MNFKSIEPIHKSDNKINFMPFFIKKLVDADSHSINENRFCVSDGVTRDLRNNDEFKFTIDPLTLLKTIRYYPQVFKLKEVSDMCTKTFTSSSITDLEKLLIIINEKIRIFNETHIGKKVDYLGNNLFGLTAAGGIIKDNRLHCFNVADSNIMVLDKFCGIVSRTDDDFTSKISERDKAMKNLCHQLSWSDNQYRADFRSIYRNTDATLSFGTLTGEKKALDHIHYYNFDLTNARYIYAYTDGYIPVMDDFMKRQEFVIKKTYKVDKEATIVGYKRI